MNGTQATKAVERLVRSGWTREGVASALSVTLYALDKWRTGKHAPIPGTAKALARLKPKASK